MKSITFSFCLIISTISCIAQNESSSNIKIESTDLQKLIGNWTGSLTYIDYNSNEAYSMPSKVIVTSIKQNRKLLMNYKYPNEPKANSKEKLRISKDKTKIDRKTIVSRTESSAGVTELITEYKGKDGNDGKAALIRKIYLIGEDTFVIRKEVKFSGTDEWIKRSEYEYVRT